MSRVISCDSREDVRAALKREWLVEDEHVRCYALALHAESYVARVEFLVFAGVTSFLQISIDAGEWPAFVAGAPDKPTDVIGFLPVILGKGDVRDFLFDLLALDEGNCHDDLVRDDDDCWAPDLNWFLLFEIGGNLTFIEHVLVSVDLEAG